MEKKVDYSRNSGNRIKQVNKLLQSDHLGKLPPQAIDIEQAVLGALMLENPSTSLYMLQFVNYLLLQTL